MSLIFHWIVLDMSRNFTCFYSFVEFNIIFWAFPEFPQNLPDVSRSRMVLDIYRNLPDLYIFFIFFRYAKMCDTCLSKSVRKRYT